MVERKKYFMDCHVAGRMYHDADEVWDELKVGTLLKLERDKEKFLEMGWKDIFECRISKLNSDTHPERQIYVTIKIKRHDQ